MKNRSSLQQLVFYQDILESLSVPNSQTDVVFMDFAKAFDTVPHNELLFKLKMLDVRGKVLL